MLDAVASPSIEFRSETIVPVAVKGHRYWPSLDGVRGIAVLSVMLCHASYGRLSGGFIGVDLFFCLSGFLITYLLTSEWRKTSQIRLGNFYARRILRLYPALVVTVLLAYFFWPKDLIGEYSRSAAGALLYHYNFLSIRSGVLGHMWSLSLEEQFYILYPPVLLLLLSTRVRASRWLLIVAFGSILLRCSLLLAHVNPILVRRSVVGRGDVLLAGGLLALWVTGSETQRHIPHHRSSEQVGWFCLVAFLLCQPVLLESSRWMIGVGQCAVTVTCAGLIYAALSIADESKLSRLLRSAPLNYLGTRSYGLYLYHFLIFNGSEFLRVAHSYGNLIWLTLFRFAISFVVAEFSFRYVERPFLKLKRRFEPKQLRQRVSAAPGGLERPYA
jgi:peptidoglycan/LPS O-acetylase OafA/YrhL